MATEPVGVRGVGVYEGVVDILSCDLDRALGEGKALEFLQRLAQNADTAHHGNGGGDSEY